MEEQSKTVERMELCKNGGAHQHGQCNENHHAHGSGHHSHATILQTLHDIDVVIAGGMGQRVYQDLVSAGKIVFVTAETDCKKAVEAFVSGNLQGSGKALCGHDHDHHAETS